MFYPYRCRGVAHFAGVGEVNEARRGLKHFAGVKGESEARRGLKHFVGGGEGSEARRGLKHFVGVNPLCSEAFARPHVHGVSGGLRVLPFLIILCRGGGCSTSGDPLFSWGWAAKVRSPPLAKSVV